jgi:Tannase and feruloyl esterase
MNSNEIAAIYKTLSALVVLTVSCSPIWAADADAGSNTRWTSRCEALASVDFSGVLDAPTQIILAKSVPTTGNVPAYCQIEGYVSPDVGIELRLPGPQWNGKFIEMGCGGSCGSAFGAACNDPMRKGYACIVSDMGHKSTAMDDKWAYNNLQAKIDFGFRATHVVALAGKAITERYYGQTPARSYFMGCSTGGRQGLVEAQRFPRDFNGIVAGAPAIHWPAVNVGFLWQALTLTKNDRAPLLSPADLKLVHTAAVASCDRDDGLADGVIGNPLSCRFDPTRLVCPAGVTAGCLSRPQVEALQRVYAGLTTSTGDRIVRSLVPGAESELRWVSQPVPLEGVALDPFRFQEVFRYEAFLPDPGPTWAVRDMDFARDYQRLGMMEAIDGGSDPDLREFKAAGGKLVLYHGWGDVLPPKNTIDYYETTERTMGGRAATQDFFRLFMIPGMGHCGGGEGAWVIDYLSYLEAWVEQGRAPDMLAGAHVKENGADTSSFPLDPAQVGFSRPVYPYPFWARYKGTGDPNSATNFRPAER